VTRSDLDAATQNARRNPKTSYFITEPDGHREELAIATQFFDDWAKNDRADAQRIGTPSAVGILFSSRWNKTARRPVLCQSSPFGLECGPAPFAHAPEQFAMIVGRRGRQATRHQRRRVQHSERPVDVLLPEGPFVQLRVRAHVGGPTKSILPV
jgi:hypothetical protein